MKKCKLQITSEPSVLDHCIKTVLQIIFILTFCFLVAIKRSLIQTTLTHKLNKAQYYLSPYNSSGVSDQFIRKANLADSIGIFWVTGLQRKTRPDESLQLKI